MTNGASLALLDGPTSAAAADTSAAPHVDIAALVATYSTLLFRVAHSVLRNHTEAEDTVQDVFVRVLEHRASLPQVRDLRVWLVRIAWNLALDRRRRIRPEQMDEAFAAMLVARDLPADAALDEVRHMHAVLRGIDALPRLERQVLLLAALEELNGAEMAAVVNKSESAVRALLFRARTHLRERLAKSSNRKGGAA